MWSTTVAPARSSSQSLALLSEMPLPYSVESSAAAVARRSWLSRTRRTCPGLTVPLVTVCVCSTPVPFGLAMTMPVESIVHDPVLTTSNHSPRIPGARPRRDHRLVDSQVVRRRRAGRAAARVRPARVGAAPRVAAGVGPRVVSRVQPPGVPTRVAAAVPTGVVPRVAVAAVARGPRPGCRRRPARTRPRRPRASGGCRVPLPGNSSRVCVGPGGRSRRHGSSTYPQGTPPSPLLASGRRSSPVSRPEFPGSGTREGSSRSMRRTYYDGARRRACLDDRSRTPGARTCPGRGTPAADAPGPGPGPRPPCLREAREPPSGPVRSRCAAPCEIATLDPADGRPVVAASAGNHGLGVAWAAARLGRTATVHVPRGTPACKRDGIAALGARVGWRTPRATTPPSVRARGGRPSRRSPIFVSPLRRPASSPPATAAPWGSRILDAISPPSTTIVAPVGGGGLMAGSPRPAPPWPRVRARRGADRGVARRCAERIETGRAVPRCAAAETLAEGLEGGVCETTFALVATRRARVDLVSEAAIADAMRFAGDALGVVDRGQRGGQARLGATAAGALRGDGTPRPRADRRQRRSRRVGAPVRARGWSRARRRGTTRRSRRLRLRGRVVEDREVPVVRELQEARGGEPARDVGGRPAGRSRRVPAQPQRLELACTGSTCGTYIAPASASIDVGGAY